MKKRLSVVLILLLCAFSGCNNGEATIQDIPDVKETGGATDNVNGKITVSPLLDQVILENAASRFMRIHPDVKVIVEQGPAFTNNSDADIAIKNYTEKVKTGIMSGTASDIIQMSIFYEYYNMVDNRLLANIGQLMENDPDMNTDLYYNNVLDSLKYKDGLYMFPTTFVYRMVGLNKKFPELLPEWNAKKQVSLIDLLNMYNNMPEGSRGGHFVEPSFSPSIVIYTQIMDYVDFNHKTCDFDNEEFVALIKDLKAVKDPDVIDGGYYTQDYYSPQEEASVASNHVFLHIDNSESQFFFDFDNSNFTAFKPLIDASGKMSMVPSDSYGITASSNNKELAWEFLKYLISPELKEGTFLFGMPVRKDTFEVVEGNTLSQAFNQALRDGYVKEGERGDITNSAINEIRKSNELPMSFSRPGYEILSILEEEFDLYLKDLTSAEQTASSIQNKVYLYLNQ